jgi:rhodanese-related sulfurtransferase
VNPEQVPTVAPGEVGEDFLLDVREDDEWAAGHAPGAVHVPLHDLPARLDAVPAGTRVAVVCRVGGRSAQATMWLRQQGYDAHNVAGGMYGWQAAGLPVEGRVL